MEAKKDVGDCLIYFSETNVAHGSLFWDRYKIASPKFSNQNQLSGATHVASVDIRYAYATNSLQPYHVCLFVCCTLQSQHCNIF